MPYSSTMVANNVLNRAFAEKLPITEKVGRKPTRCQRVGKVTWSYGPVLYSVRDKFRNFANNEPITKFARDAHGNACMIKEAEDPCLQLV